MKTKHSGAARRTAATYSTQAGVKDARHLADALAAQVDPDGLLAVNVTIRLHPVVLILLARKARHEDRTLDSIVGEWARGGKDGYSGILETLRDYENGLPATTRPDSRLALAN